MFKKLVIVVCVIAIVIYIGMVIDIMSNKKIDLTEKLKTLCLVLLVEILAVIGAFGAFAPIIFLLKWYYSIPM